MWKISEYFALKENKRIEENAHNVFILKKTENL